jgi:hypothetical protein
MKLSSNKDLYDYLVLLAVKLREAGAGQLAESVLAASRTSSSFPATEFLGESRIALRRVSEMDVCSLTNAERVDLLDVLDQLNIALDRR